MREEQEQSEVEDAEERVDSDPEPFDQNPPVSPGEPQVGNSRAQFFMPREESEDGDDEDDEREVREGDA